MGYSAGWRRWESSEVSAGDEDILGSCKTNLTELVLAFLVTLKK